MGPNLVHNRAMNLGDQLGPMSITKLSPNYRLAKCHGPHSFPEDFAVWVAFAGRIEFNSVSASVEQEALWRVGLRENACSREKIREGIIEGGKRECRDVI